MHEVETKVLEVEPKEIEQKLAALGAKMILDTRFAVDWFKLKTERAEAVSWYLRIRRDSEGHSEVTWKGKSEILGTARKHREINFFASEPSKMAEIFEALGLEAYAHQEKYRRSWVWRDFRFDLDQYPKMPPYLEIEAENEAAINEAIALLKLKKHKTSSEGEKLLIEKRYRLDWMKMVF